MKGDPNINALDIFPDGVQITQIDGRELDLREILQETPASVMESAAGRWDGSPDIFKKNDW